MYVDLETIKLLWPELILVLLASWIYIGGTVQQSRQWWTLFSLAGYVDVLSLHPSSLRVQMREPTASSSISGIMHTRLDPPIRWPIRDMYPRFSSVGTQGYGPGWVKLHVRGPLSTSDSYGTTRFTTEGIGVHVGPAYATHNG